MSDQEFLGGIFPAHKDLHSIIQRLRSKYGLSDFEDPDQNLIGLLDYEESVP